MNAPQLVTLPADLRPYGRLAARESRERNPWDGDRCACCAKPMKAGARHWIGVDMGTGRVFTTDAPVAPYDTTFEPVGADCARKIRKLGVLRTEAQTTYTE